LLNGIDANGGGHSTVGWYPHIANVIGTQPQAIVDFSGFEIWEQQNQNGMSILQDLEVGSNSSRII
jgi:hypothetical protein